MIRTLTIHNVALIESVSIGLHDGMIVLSGETGAGKSIIIDAVNLILGGRADRDLIRSGCERASVEAVFEAVHDRLLDDLLEHFPIGEGYILAPEREVYGHAIDGHTTNVLFAIHAVCGKADDHIVIVRHPFGQIHGNGLDAAQIGVVVLGNV